MMYESTLYDYYMKVTPFDWEFNITEEIYRQWSSIMKNGEPFNSEWSQTGANYETYFIYETETKMKSALEIKMIDFWLNEWSPEWQPAL